MKKQITIEQIAEMAGVSRGTVDRVLHNRGKVSLESMEAIAAVLDKVGYQYNLHVSAVSLKKTYRIAVMMPTPVEGEYWGLIRNGIESAANEYSDFRLDIVFFFYDQFDAESCEKASTDLLSFSPDGAVIGPIFVEHTLALCRTLENRRIPYVFVDSFIKGTNPLACFVADQMTCGRLIGKLLLSSVPAGSSIAVMDIDRRGQRNKDNFSERNDGLLQFASEKMGPGSKVYHAVFSYDRSENVDQVMGFLESHPDVKGIAVLNSRGYLVADVLRDKGIKDVHVVSMDLTEDNKRCLKDETISALVCQRPQLQSFFAIQSIIKYLLYRNNDTPQLNFLPIDIVFPENITYNQDADITWLQINTLIPSGK